MTSVEKTSLDGVRLIQVEGFEDHRGEYVETYNKRIYQDAGIEAEFVQDDYSVSTKHVLRGLHGDATTWKLVYCPFGKFYLVVVNCDMESSQFGRWESFVLSDRNRRQVLIPPKFGNGHLILSDTAIFGYKQSRYYDRATQFTYRWDDPRFGIWWPLSDPVLSQRDQSAHLWNENAKSERKAIS
jgi:dTDP-4-dehydrorhamnose 3,5-epimerase